MEVEILGKLTRVNCPKGQEEALQAAAVELNQRLKDMAERTKVHNVEQLLTIAALNACYEVLSLKQDTSAQQEIDRRLSDLTQLLDDSLLTNK